MAAYPDKGRLHDKRESFESLGHRDKTQRNQGREGTSKKTLSLFLAMAALRVLILID
jgi:hypothetical protein